MAWYVYIVRCSDGTYYTGAAKDVFARVDKHNSGRGAKYTRARLPVTLLWVQECDDKSAALRLEYQIKQLDRAQKELIVGM